MIRKLLIANRGEIACRVMRTAHEMGIATVAVYSDADANAMHVAMADEAVRIGPAPVAESYLRGDAIIEAARQTGADAIHPGYGFLSENPEFVEAVTAAGLTFVGPPAEAIRAMGLKDAAKARMEAAGVPVVPGYHGERQDAAFLEGEADAIGYPVLIKARAGGGGKGMRMVERPEDFAAALASAQGEGQSAFGDPRVLIEKFITAPRHIEIQVFADGHGNALHLFERDCSLQRRHQKVIEEAPAPGMTPEMRAAMGEAAVKAALAVGYQGAGTVEFIADGSEGLRSDRFYFMEMNTRLQVEHPVTEAITGQDLVEWQLRVASGEALPLAQDDLSVEGWAFEARLYAEAPGAGFLPQTGTLSRLHLDDTHARIDTGVREGDTITPFYDPMIAKVITHGPTRGAALSALARTLAASDVTGCETNLAFLHALSRHEGFAAGDVDTGLIGRDLEALTAAAAPSDTVTAVAAVASLGLVREEPTARDPFDTLIAFRPWGAAEHAVTLLYGGEGIAARVRLEPFGGGSSAGTPRYTVALRRAGSASEVVCTPFALSRDGARLSVLFETSRTTLRLAEEGGSVTLFEDGVAYGFTRPDPLTRADEQSGGGDTIAAPMPGVVKVVGVEAGQAVAEGDLLVVMEAMKMEHRLTAPRDGTVGEVMASAGDQVEEGALLVALAAEEEEAA